AKPTRKENRHADEHMHKQGAGDRNHQVPAGLVLRKESPAPCRRGARRLEHFHRTIISQLEGVEQDAQGDAAMAPPSTMTCVPDMNDDASEARKSAHRAMSSGSPTRPSGMPWPSRAARSTRSTMSAVRRVRIVPGQMAFTRMPSRP